MRGGVVNLPLAPVEEADSEPVLCNRIFKCGDHRGKHVWVGWSGFAARHAFSGKVGTMGKMQKALHMWHVHQSRSMEDFAERFPAISSQSCSIT